MKRKLLWGLAVIAAVTVVLSGCQSTTEPAEDELAVLKEMIESDPLFTSDQMLLNDAADQAGLSKTTAPILPIAWGRRVDNANRSVTFERFGDTLVIATIVQSMSGKIVIAHRDTVQDTTLVIEKPFAESTTRKVRATKIARTNNPRANWRFREVSGVDGGTTSNSAITFDTLKAFIGNDTLVVTDPTEFFLRFADFAGRHIPSILNSAPVKVRLTITSTESDTDLVFIHRPAMWVNSSVLRPARIRMTLVSQTGSGPYTRVYEHTWSSHVQGRHHFFVGAVTRGSLFDDVAPWSTKIWGIPYLVSP
ncbi:MAG: hypothetical protein HBSIN02_15930 [Bacteroidia bacterium]|nr:MAG: hypothetical protein HBSIN02_15930 [Bacteroidia bacterium]